MSSPREGRPLIELAGSHRPRAVRPYGVHSACDWQIKLYGVAATDKGPRRRLLDRALEIAVLELPQPAVTEDRHGTAFVIAHDTPRRCFVLVDWWCDHNQIFQKVFSGQVDGLLPHLEPSIGCIWELAVTDFERRAWIEDVLTNPSGPDVDRYLSRSLTAVL